MSAVHGVDLSGFVTSALDLDPWQRSILERLPAGTITLGFDRALAMRHRAAALRHYDRIWAEWQQICQLYRAIRQQRVSRMHAAYRRRRR